MHYIKVEQNNSVPNKSNDFMRFQMISSDFKRNCNMLYALLEKKTSIDSINFLYGYSVLHRLLQKYNDIIFGEYYQII